MKKMLLEVDTDECKLTMSDGSKWSVNPGDITICCAWLPTSELVVKGNSDAIYNYTITNGGVSIRAMRIS